MLWTELVINFLFFVALIIIGLISFGIYERKCPADFILNRWLFWIILITSGAMMALEGLIIAAPLFEYSTQLLVEILYGIFYIFYPVSFYFCVLFIKFLKREFKLVYQNALYAIIPIITTVLVIINFFTGFIYTINPADSIYPLSISYTNFIYLIYGLNIVNLLICVLVYLLKSGTLKEHYKLKTLVFFIEIAFGALNLLLFYFGMVDFTFPFLIMEALALIVYRVYIESKTDSLTNLPNRNAFFQEIQKYKKYIKKGKVFCAAMLDINKFSEINLKLGHLKGDEAINKTGEIIKNALSDSMKIYRYAGDEFILLAKKNTLIDAFSIRKKIDEECDKFNSTNKDYKIKLSVGVYEFEKLSDIEYYNVIEKIDKKMYKEKNRQKKEENELLHNRL